MRINLFSSDDDFNKIMKEYFKQGSERPDFMLSIPSKLKTRELKQRQNTEYLFGMLYILQNINDNSIKEEIKDKLLEELVIQVVELNNDKTNIHSD